MHLACGVLNEKLKTGGQQPSMVVVMNLHSSAIGDMDIEGTKRLGVEKTPEFVGQHGRTLTTRLSGAS